MKHPDLYKTHCDYSQDERVAKVYKQLPKECSVALTCCQKDDDMWTEDVCVSPEVIKRQAYQDIESQLLRSSEQDKKNKYLEEMTIKLYSEKSKKEEKYTR